MPNALRTLLIAGLLLAAGSLQAQSSQTTIWQKLADVHYVQTELRYVPNFGRDAQNLNGKSVTIEGFLYPINAGFWHEHFFLSALPPDACFFCGVGGPETVVEVVMAKGYKVRGSEEPIRLTGTLRLTGENNSYSLFYYLENAQEAD